VSTPAPAALSKIGGVLVPPAPLGTEPYRLVFVCTGNICRSPMAEVVTRAMATAIPLVDGTTLADHLEVTSAGTGPWHEGEPMHALAQTALIRAGYPDDPHVAHQVVSSELGAIDLLVALDRRHQQTLRSLGADPGRLALLRAFDPAAGAAADVPDPYYGDDAVFDDCRDMIAAGCRGLVSSLVAQWETLGVPAK
jgi:low molecular weight protein-tyrosine phosphatase